MMADLTGCLEELASRSLLPADPVAVYAVGSLARGWANERSDYDFNVVSLSPWEGASVRTIPIPLDVGTVPTSIRHVAGRRWEVKYWLDSQVDQMLGKVTWEQFEEGTSTSKALVDTEELFLERLITCLPLCGSDWVAARRESLANTAFRAFVTTHSLAEADGAVEDALGQLAASDVVSAVLSAHKALGHIVDALLESYDNYGSRTPKWRARRFQETSPKELSFEKYWELETMRHYDPNAPQDWVNRVVTLCRNLTLEVEIR